MDHSTVDILWLVIASALVFLMQAGFLCLETGLTRSKNNINVAIKNLADLAISILLFWLFGFALMFGTSWEGVVGGGLFAFDFGESSVYFNVFFVFQMMFCGAAITIFSGAIAERLRFFSYAAFAIFTSGLIYPIFGHWVWNGIDQGLHLGWLAQLGFFDFAGGTVVHSLGGWIALAVLLIVGARHGRFPHNKPPQTIVGTNVPLASLGVLLLYLGWIGFNGGSNLRLDHHVGVIIINTLLAGAAGALGPTLFAIFWDGVARVDGLLNGVLAGLVAVTASVNVISTAEAVLIGFIGGLIMSYFTYLLEKWRIDDAIGVVPVHLGAGMWGTLAVGFFGDLEQIGTGLSRPNQIGVQLLGIVVCGIWSFGLMYLCAWLLNRWAPIRVSPQDEIDGLNSSEHGVSDPWLELVDHMDEQAEQRAWDRPAPVEPFTEAGRVAEHYNRVLEALNQTIYRANAVVNRAMDGIITFSKGDLLISTFNPAAELIFGYTSGEVLSQPVTDLLRVTQPAVSLSQDVVFRTFEPILHEAVQADFPVELIGRRADGTRFPVEVTLAETSDETGELYIGTFRDITVRKQGREELEAARDAAEAANRSKSAFLANMSHELRTPLNAVIGYSEILLEDVRVAGQKQFQPDLNKIQTAGRHLLDLINNILDLSKIEAGHTAIYVEDIDLHLLMTEIKVTMQPLVHRNGSSFDVYMPSDSAVLHTDVIKLKQILINLLSNAAKFTRDGSVMLSCVLERVDEQDVATFYISDTGIGISSTEIEYLFEPFTQADLSTTRQYGGTGLGLAITKRFCEMLDGQIQVNSELGRGSTFSVQIPQKYGEVNRKSGVAKITRLAGAQESLPERRKIILVIDDDPASLGVVAHHLTREGFHVEQAQSGAEGLLKAKQVLPDLITLDVNMPDMDGWQVLAELKQDIDLQEIPVVLLTISEERNKGFTLGASDFLTKPIQKDTLLQSVDRLAGARRFDDAYILLVEDDEMIGEVVQRTLERDGWHVIRVGNGRLAIEVLQTYKHLPALILLDLMMPEVDGFMFVDIVRLNSKWLDIPIVVVTAKDLSVEDRARLSGGVDQIMQKSGRDIRSLITNIRDLIDFYAVDDRSAV